ncbi:hypothetical protein C4D60_Mb10t01330 [Musa balbisiana]|uniref:BHLH domain-containing protein n=1 Tax=Musa balbisiana TaxID=52838 RepID=A0A4S8ITZ5_MUSBA|nr:hypothetical protein C4D60_Mb10t01330 [Musa balbisiana]
MALEAVVFSRDLHGCTMKERYNVGGAAWCRAFAEQKGMESECEVGGGKHGSLDAPCTSLTPKTDARGANTPPPGTAAKDGADGTAGHEAPAGRRKRRRIKTFKNQEEVENQRMTHIAVERNRRKQMNEYLGALRSLMPASYVQRGDQASIIGGAINFVKELEQLVQSLEARKRIEQTADAAPFADFFTFPQYSTTSSRGANNGLVGEEAQENRPALADIEVTMVESHANLKVLSRRRPKQLLKMVAGLHDLRLTILHLNVTTVAEMAFCSFSLKVEDDCQLSSVDDIATAVHELVGTIQEEADRDTTTF